MTPLSLSVSLVAVFQALHHQQVSYPKLSVTQQPYIALSLCFGILKDKVLKNYTGQFMLRINLWTAID